LQGNRKCQIALVHVKVIWTPTKNISSPQEHFYFGSLDCVRSSTSCFASQRRLRDSTRTLSRACVGWPVLDRVQSPAGAEENMCGRSARRLAVDFLSFATALPSGLHTLPRRPATHLYTTLLLRRGIVRIEVRGILRRVLRLQVACCASRSSLCPTAAAGRCS
jgi:hypothetical protein